MTARRVAVTGVGLVTPFGSDPRATFARFMAGESAIAIYRPEHAPQPLAVPAVRAVDFDPIAAVGRAPAFMMDRFAQFGVAAAIGAWQDAGLPPTAPVPERSSVFWGCGMGGAATIENAYFDILKNGRNRVAPLMIVMGMSNAAAGHIAIKYQLGGETATYSVACASSAIAIGEAFRRVRSGAVDLAVAGGSEAPLTLGNLLAWEAMRVMAKATDATAAAACRPFDAKRGGLVLGEGGAALILEPLTAAQARGARIYAEMIGYGASCDHRHVALPDADGQAGAMTAALADAGLDLADVGYVNAHATATQDGDPIEIAALAKVFGALAPQLAVSATKSMHGHMLGATGALETAITVLAVQQQAVPPTAYLEQVAPDCAGVRHISGRGVALSMRAALSNSFAFGGSNAVIALRTPG